MACATSSGSANRLPIGAPADAFHSSVPITADAPAVLPQIGVFTPPGATAFTRTPLPSWAHSNATAVVSMMTAALLAQYAAAAGAALMPEADATLTMLPPPDRLMDRTPARVPRNTPSRLTARTRRQSASVVSVTGPTRAIPAQF